MQFSRFSVLSALLLAACAAPFPAQSLPQLAAGDSRWFKLERLNPQGEVEQTSLLAVQGEGSGRSRWIQTDAFGAPQARLLATPEGWQRDGFIWPNREAGELFQNLFPYINEPHRLPETLPARPDGRWRITPITPP